MDVSLFLPSLLGKKISYSYKYGATIECCDDDDDDAVGLLYSVQV